MSKAAGNSDSTEMPPQGEEHSFMPPWPAALAAGLKEAGESFAVTDARVPNETPRWLLLPELAGQTGFFVTGTIGSYMTSAVICSLDGPDRLTWQPANGGK